MESQNLYSVLADAQEEGIKDNPVYNNIQEIFFNTFSSLIRGALETLPQVSRPWSPNIDTLQPHENPEIEDHSHDEMDDIILDTNQQSSRIISEETPKPIPVQASSSMPTSKSGKDKSGAKKSNDQHKKSKDTPKPNRKSADKNSKKITKLIIMKDIPDSLKNNVHRESYISSDLW
ncbi:hypothetical protein RCL_jg17732.t1 [Rhizophagus clarus]|nr:hypothetical protein RCL_jg17732.t1 [Rhizophagus clarus]